MTERLVAHILIGLPGSGKSTLARRLAAIHNPATIVSSDEIRKHLYGDESIQGSNAQVFRQAERELFSALRAGRSVIYDATNINQRFRRMTLREMRQAGASWIIGYWLKVPMGICQERNRKRRRVVPEEVLLRMLHDLRDFPPQFADGFDEIVILGKEAEICSGWSTNVSTG